MQSITNQGVCKATGKISLAQILSCLGISVGFLAWLQPLALGQSLSIIAEPTQINQLATPQTLVIPPITASEIVPGGKSDSVSNSNDLLTPPDFNTLITREFRNFWQMRVPRDQVGSLYASYEFKSSDGTTNAVNNLQDQSSTLPIIIEPLPIVEISTDENTNTALVQGGFRLTINLAATKLAGTYGGNVTVIVNQR